jgi:hypothetical protein
VPSGGINARFSDDKLLIDALHEQTNYTIESLNEQYGWLAESGLMRVRHFRQLDKNTAREVYRYGPTNFLVRSALSLIYGEPLAE